MLALLKRLAMIKRATVRSAAMLLLFALMAITADANQSANNPTASGQNATQPSSTQGTNQTVPSTTDQNNANIRLGPGTAPSGDVAANAEMRATLDTPLSSKTSQPGDRFTATVVQPVSGRNGVVIPAGARVEGEVSESEQGKAAAALRGRGVLNLRLRDIVLPNGQTVPVVASLVSVNRTNGESMQRVDKDGQIQSGAPRTNVAKDIDAGGPGSGTVFGGPLKGLAIGAMAGGGYVLATTSKEVNLPAQTGLVIRLDQGLRVE